MEHTCCKRLVTVSDAIIGRSSSFSQVSFHKEDVGWVKHTFSANSDAEPDKILELSGAFSRISL